MTNWTPISKQAALDAFRSAQSEATPVHVIQHESWDYVSRYLKVQLLEHPRPLLVIQEVDHTGVRFANGVYLDISSANVVMYTDDEQHIVHTTWDSLAHPLSRTVYNIKAVS